MSETTPLGPVRHSSDISPANEHPPPPHGTEAAAAAGGLAQRGVDVGVDAEGDDSDMDSESETSDIEGIDEQDFDADYGEVETGDIIEQVGAGIQTASTSASTSNAWLISPVTALRYDLQDQALARARHGDAARCGSVASTAEATLLASCWPGIVKAELAPLLELTPPDLPLELRARAEKQLASAKARKEARKLEAERANEQQGLAQAGEKGKGKKKTVNSGAQRVRQTFDRRDPVIISPYMSALASQWTRTVRFYADRATKQPHTLGFGCVNARKWQGLHLSTHIIILIAAVARQYATPVGLRVQDALEDLPTFVNGDFWDSMGEQSSNAAFAGLAGSESDDWARKLLRGGVYIGVVLRWGFLVGIYDGRTISHLFRAIEHFTGIIFGKKAHFYEGARRGEKVWIFPVFIETDEAIAALIKAMTSAFAANTSSTSAATPTADSASTRATPTAPLASPRPAPAAAVAPPLSGPTRSSGAAAASAVPPVSRGRAVIEGLWADATASFQGNEGYLDLRKDYGLNNPGKGVAGLNSTACIEAPEQDKQHIAAFKTKTMIDDHGARVINDRVTLYPRLAYNAAARGNAASHARFCLLSEAANFAARVYLGPLVYGASGVRFQMRKGSKCLPLGLEGRDEDLEVMWRNAPSGRWTMTIETEGGPVSFPSLCAFERARYGDLRVVLRATFPDEEPGGSAKHTFSWPTGPLPAYVRRAAERLHNLRPPELMKERLRLQNEEIEAMEALRQPGYEQLSLRARRFQDGLYLIRICQTAVVLVLDELIVRLTGTPDAIQALMASGEVALGQAVPVRGGVFGRGCAHPAVALLQGMQAQPHWWADLSKVGSMPSAWQPLPWPMPAAHGVVDVIRIYQELQSQGAMRSMIPPLFSAPFQLSVTSQGHVFGGLHLEQQVRRALGVVVNDLVWLRLDGEGKRNVQDIPFYASADKERWIRVWLSVVSLRNLLDSIRRRRELFEREFKAPWADGVWAREMTVTIDPQVPVSGFTAVAVTTMLHAPASHLAPSGSSSGPVNL